MTNPLYADTGASDLLLPPLSTLLRCVTLWTDYYFRWTEASSNHPSSSSGGHDPSTCADRNLPTIFEGSNIFERKYLSEKYKRERIEQELAEIRILLGERRSNETRVVESEEGVDESKNYEFVPENYVSSVSDLSVADE